MNRNRQWGEGRVECEEKNEVEGEITGEEVKVMEGDVFVSHGGGEGYAE